MSHLRTKHHKTQQFQQKQSPSVTKTGLKLKLTTDFSMQGVNTLAPAANDTVFSN